MRYAKLGHCVGHVCEVDAKLSCKRSKPRRRRPGEQVRLQPHGNDDGRAWLHSADGVDCLIDSLGHFLPIEILQDLENDDVRILRQELVGAIVEEG